MKRGFIICGPESSGNHLILKLLKEYGCKSTNNLNFIPAGDKYVFISSMPKGQIWYDLKKVIKKFTDKNYDVTLLVPTRSWFASSKSQVQRHAPKNKKVAFDNIQKAYKKIFRAIDATNVNWIMVNFENMIYEKEEYINKLVKQLGFEPKELKTVITNTNKKWM